MDGERNQDELNTIGLSLPSPGLGGWIILSVVILIFLSAAGWILYEAYQRSDFWKIPQYIAGGLLAILVIMGALAPVYVARATRIRGRQIILESKLRTIIQDLDDLRSIERSLWGGGLMVRLRFRRGKSVCLLPIDTERDQIKHC